MARLEMDTMKFEGDLEAAGLKREQAQASVEAVAKVFSNAADDLISRVDLQLTTTQLRTDVKSALEAQHRDLMHWIVAIALGQVVGTIVIILGVVFASMNAVTNHADQALAAAIYAQSAAARAGIARPGANP